MTPPTPSTHLRFSETMVGYISFGEADYTHGYQKGRQRETDLALHLTLEFGDLDQLLSGRGSQAQASGFVNCDALGGKLPLEGGTFRLFVGDEPHQKTMCYRLHCRDAVGHPLTLIGVKVMQKSKGRKDKGSGSRVWRDTTTLYLRVVQGSSVQDMQAEEAVEVVASGILHLGLLSFAEQLTTFRADAPSSIGQLAAVARFGGFFLRQLWQVYGARLERLP